MSTEEQKPPEEGPQNAGGGPVDSAAKAQGFPIEVFTQRVPVMHPGIAEQIRAAIERFEGDECKRVGGEWFYIRTRAFLDLKKAKGMVAGGQKTDVDGAGNRAGEGGTGEPGSGAPDGAVVPPSPGQPSGDDPRTPDGELPPQPDGGAKV